MTKSDFCIFKSNACGTLPCNKRMLPVSVQNIQSKLQQVITIVHQKLLFSVKYYQKIKNLTIIICHLPSNMCRRIYTGEIITSFVNFLAWIQKGSNKYFCSLSFRTWFGNIFSRFVWLKFIKLINLFNYCFCLNFKYPAVFN